MKIRANQLFSLIPDRVQVGDIVLISGAAAPSLLIRVFTLSRFSHVAICTRPGMLLEAVSAGVLRTTVFQTHANRRKSIRVLRLKGTYNRPDLALQVEDYAERLYGYGYSTLGAIATRIPFWNFDDKEAVFCSRLVVSAYAEYGVNLFPGRKLHKVVPGMFIRSSKLDDVTAQCVRAVHEVRDAELYYQIIATSKIDFTARQMGIERQAFEAIRTQLGDRLPLNINSLPMLRGWLSHHSPEARAVDTTIVEILNKQGYIREMEAWLASVEAETAELDRALSLAVPCQPSGNEMQTYLSLFSEVVSLSEIALASRFATATEYQRLAQQSPLNTIIYFRDLYQRQYDIFSRKHRTILRLMDAFKRCQLEQ